MLERRFASVRNRPPRAGDLRFGHDVQCGDHAAIHHGCRFLQAFKADLGRAERVSREAALPEEQAQIFQVAAIASRQFFPEPVQLHGSVR